MNDTLQCSDFVVDPADEQDEVTAVDVDRNAEQHIAPEYIRFDYPAAETRSREKIDVQPLHESPKGNNKTLKPQRGTNTLDFHSMLREF